MEAQLRKVLVSNPQPVDAGACNGRLFLNGVGIGFDGAVVRSMGRKRIVTGHMAYLLTVLKKIFVYREPMLELEYNNIRGPLRTFMISVANGSRYGGGFMVAPQAVVDDGWFDLVVIRKIHPIKRLFYLPKVEKGRHLALPIISISKVRAIIVRAEKAIPAHVDGELMEDKEFRIEILPGRFLFRGMNGNGGRPKS